MDHSHNHFPPAELDIKLVGCSKLSVDRPDYLYGDRGIMQEMEALRKLRMAVSKMIRHINQGDEHPKDLQQVKLFLSEAEKSESPLVRGPRGV
jgi:hypothetical protein